MEQLTVQQAFAMAVEHHRQGRLAQAEGMYRQILGAYPDEPEVLRLLGVLLHQTGRTEAGVQMLQRAISLLPQSRDAHGALGQILAGLGRLPEAAGAFERALAIDPSSADVCSDLGNVYLGLGRVDAALGMYQRALVIRPDFPEALTNLSAALMRQSRFDEAIAACGRALAVRPDFLPARSNLGIALRQAGRFDEAIEALRAVLSRDASNADALLNLAEAYRESGRLDEAMKAAEQTVRLHPNSPEAHNALGIVRMSLKQWDAAIESYRKAIALRPGFADAHYNIGTVLQEMGREEQAIAEFQLAIELAPMMVQVWNNLGNALMNLGRYDECIAAQRRAIAINPQQASAHFNLGVALLTKGNLPEGFREFEWRWQTPELSLSKRRFAQPRWNGEPLAGRTILLHGEQGFGDTIQFVRYVPRVRERGGRIVLACQSELSRLLKQVNGVEQIVTEKDRLPPFDVHCALMSLPQVLGTTLETIPGDLPYLHADPQRSQAWRERLEPYAGRKKIGLSWAGRPTHSQDRRRSIALKSLAPLAREGACFISLQKGNGSEQASDPPKGMELLDWTSELSDFTDTAALIDQLDLVITVDTSIAHLAGAMGKPVWVLLPYAPDWRWMLDRSESPWYPTLRLFRQLRMDDWDEVIRRVARELGGWQ